MAILARRDQGELMESDLWTLRVYAERVIVHGETLTSDEEDDREARFREFAEIGDSIGLTEREMVNMLFDGLLQSGPKCRCTECRSRDMA